VPPIRRKITVLPGQPPKDAQLVEVSNASETWNQYLLTDGTVLKLKVIVTEIWRLEGEYDNDGNPLYVVRSGNVLAVNAPDEVRRPGG
jgi:hypothetical protein